MSYIDLHMHTKYSDGEYEVGTVLKECSEAGLSTISITDHESVDAYKDLESLEIRGLFKGEIIPGIELSFNLEDHVFDVLGYDIDYKKMRATFRR